MHDLPGTRLILMTLLEQGTSPTEKRSIRKRYNIIMKAIYGDMAKKYLIGEKDRGGQRKDKKNNIHINLVLLAMNKEWKRGKYKSYRKLAKKFVDKIVSHSTPENTISRLANEFSKRKKELDDPKSRYWMEYVAYKRDIDKNNHNGDWMLENEVKVALEGVGWDFGDYIFEYDMDSIDWREENLEK